MAAHRSGRLRPRVWDPPRRRWDARRSPRRRARAWALASMAGAYLLTVMALVVWMFLLGARAGGPAPPTEPMGRVCPDDGHFHAMYCDGTQQPADAGGGAR